MKGNLARRIEGLEQRDGKGKDIIVFWSGPEDNGKVTEAQRESDRTGRSLLIIRWAECAGGTSGA
jgi:hypothetical protein